MTGPLRILIVEDEAVVLMQVEMVLEDAGHTIVGTAMSVAEAIPLIRQTRPELLLLDLNLGDGSSGLEVARAVRDQAGLMIVFVTANAAKLADDMHGGSAVIAKPFNEQTLEGSIAYLQQCVRSPPPGLDLPEGLRLDPAYRAALDGMRGSL